MRQELWETTINRSFNRFYGLKRVQDLIAIMKPSKIAYDEKFIIFPVKDKRVIRVIRKVVRGLCYYHKVVSPLSDERVWVDVLKYSFPQEFLKQMDYAHRERDIVEYRWGILNEEGISSVWIIKFFEQVTFISLVSMSEKGFV